MNIGIGVITYNRLDHLKGCIEKIRQHTKIPYTLVVVDDGSTDGTQEWVKESKILLVTGQNKGVCWNKNRALYFLLNQTRCESLILLEDDSWPCDDAWLLPWHNASKRWGHMNFASPALLAHPKLKITGHGSVLSPYRSNLLTGQCSAVSRDAMAVVGYLDTRFKGYGHGHVEWTTRFLKNNFGGKINANGHKEFLSLKSGLAIQAAQSFVNQEQIKANSKVFAEIAKEESYREPWQNNAEKEEFLSEINTTLTAAKSLNLKQEGLSHLILSPQHAAADKKKPSFTLQDVVNLRKKQDVALLQQGMKESPALLDQYGHPAFKKELMRLFLLQQQWDEAIKLIPNQGDLGGKHWHKILFARAYSATDDLKNAQLWWTLVLELYPNNPEAQAFLSLQYNLNCAAEVKIFQIGFNKCATTSFNRFFNQNGFKSVHWESGEIAEKFFNRLNNKEDPFLDYPDVVGFTDMMKITHTQLLEPYKAFEYIYQWYPDAYFILNTRNCNDWLDSRVKHGLVERYKSVLSLPDEASVRQYWREEWYEHHAKVLKFFSTKQQQLLIYDIDSDTPDKLVTFLANIGTLNPDFFGHSNKTKE